MIRQLNPNSEQILKARYYVDDQEDWPALCRRVTETVLPPSCSKYNYTEEETRERTEAMFTLINELYFVPNSPTLFNAGTQYPMLSACFIINVDDDLPSIYESVKESAMIHKMGGGVGFSLHKLRCRGSRIGTTHGVSSGAVSFLRVFSSASEEITAGGRRRGANMCMLNVEHADVLEFLSCKEREGDISNFNISVTASDAFMDAVKAGLSFDLVDPKDGSVVRTVDARELMLKIAHGAWLNGEPGLCFIDRVNRDNPVPHMERIASSNPCQPGWATVLTPRGMSTFDSLDVGDVIWSGSRWTKVVRKEFTGEKPVYAYRTRAGVFYGTENHRVVSNGVKVEAKDAESIDLAKAPQDMPRLGDTSHRANIVMDGLVLGDGMYHTASKNVVLIVGDNDNAYFEDPELSKYFIEPSTGIKEKSWFVKTSFDHLPKTYDRVVPEHIRFGSTSAKLSFLRGLYSANGSVVSNRVTLKASSEKLIEQVQEILSSVGVYSYYTVNREHDVEFSNGIYTCRESYDLNIGYLEGRKIFRDLIGFLQPYKMEKLRDICTDAKQCKDPKSTYDIVDVEYVSTEAVYDITVDAPEHTYWTGGLLVSNCGEFYNISYNSCNLGSLNLTKYVKDKQVDWELLRQHTHRYVEYLDCIIDANHYPLEKIDRVTKATRPVGLGVMGLADMLIMLGIRYDSDEGISLSRDIAEFLSYHSLEASVELAEKRGPYPEFRVENHRYELQSKLGKLDWASLLKKIEEHGLRNSHAIVIAPTGTIARLANETSFGIEPVFALSFQSNIIDSQQHTKHHLYQEFLDGKLDVPREVFVTSGEIHWKRHVDMQAAWQDFTHNGISKTINMAEGITEEEVLEAYLYAYEAGLKGITVYVAGSREAEVLVSSDRAAKKAGRKPKDIDMDILRKLVSEGGMTASQLSDLFDCSISTIRRRVKELNMSSQLLPDKISRPDELWGPKYRIQTPSGNVYIEIGGDAETGAPIETIVTISKSGSSENAMAEALGKMVSKALQHRMDPQEVIETLKDIMGGDAVGWWRGKSIKSIPDALAHALQTYLGSTAKKKTPEGETTVLVSDAGSCPQCGEITVKVEGCEYCPGCSHGKCS